MENIEYFEKDGELWFSCEEKIFLSTKTHVAAYRVSKSLGKIPEKIQEQGKEAIKRYVEKKIKRGAHCHLCRNLCWGKVCKSCFKKEKYPESQRYIVRKRNKQ